MSTSIPSACMRWPSALPNTPRPPRFRPPPPNPAPRLEGSLGKPPRRGCVGHERARDERPDAQLRNRLGVISVRLVEHEHVDQRLVTLCYLLERPLRPSRFVQVTLCYLRRRGAAGETREHVRGGGPGRAAS